MTDASNLTETAPADGGLPKGAAAGETWRDWLTDADKPVTDLLTREEIAEAVKELGRTVQPSDMRYWEAEGIIPRGVRQWHNDASRMVYPGWYVPMLMDLRSLQEAGMPLEAISRGLRGIYCKPDEFTGGTNYLASYRQGRVMPAATAYFMTAHIQRNALARQIGADVKRDLIGRNAAVVHTVHVSLQDENGRELEALRYVVPPIEWPADETDTK